MHIDLRETHIIGVQTRERMVSDRECDALRAHGIGMVGLSETAGDFRFVRLRPRMAQLLFTVEGWGWVYEAGDWRRAEAGALYVTPPGRLHAYHAEPGAPWRIAWVVYTDLGAGLPDVGVAEPTLRPAHADPVAAAIEGLYREQLEAGAAAVTHHWASLIQAYAERALSQAGMEGRLRALWHEVDSHLDREWTVEEMATAAGVSGEHLRRLCQASVGCSPMRHVARLRMRRAAGLLASDSYTVEDVAGQVGYSNPFAFSSAFKRRFGLAPSAYRLARPAGAAKDET